MLSVIYNSLPPSLEPVADTHYYSPFKIKIHSPLIMNTSPTTTTTTCPLVNETGTEIVSPTGSELNSTSKLLTHLHTTETVGTLNPSRDNAFTYEAHCRDHDGGDQGVEVRNSDVPHMNVNVNGASLTLSGVDTSDNFYEGEDEDDGGHAEVVLEARRMRGHVAAMFHSSQKITKALIGLSLFISMIIFSAGIGGIISHNKEVTARNFAIAGGEDCPKTSKGSKAPNKGSKTKGGSKMPARRLESLRGMKGDIEVKQVPMNLKNDTNKRNLVSPTQH